MLMLARRLRTLGGGMFALVVLGGNGPMGGVELSSDRCLGCQDCLTAEGWTGHYINIMSSPFYGLNQNPHQDCIIGDCGMCIWMGGCHGHAYCTADGMALKDAQSAQAALVGGNIDKIAELVDGSSGRLVLNVPRSTLQAVGCNDAIVAQVSLKRSDIARLQRAIATN